MLMNLDAARQLPLCIDEAIAPPWNIRRSARARRLCARVHRDGRVDIVIPQRAPATVVQDFMARHRNWIETKAAQARALAPPAAAFPPERIALPALGRSLRVHLAGGRQPPRVRLLADGILAIKGEVATQAALRRALQRWLMACARVELGGMLRHIAAEHGFHYSGISIRRQRTRWGSCSTRRRISLNVCLMFQPVDVVRYLLIHELAHTLHMNHSDRFWATVARCCPNWRTLDRELLRGWRHVPSWLFS